MDKVALQTPQPMACSPDDTAVVQYQYVSGRDQPTFSQPAFSRTDGTGPRDALILELRSRIAAIVARPASWLRTMPGSLPEGMLDPTTVPAVASPSDPARPGMVTSRSVCPFLPSTRRPRAPEPAPSLASTLAPSLSFGIAAIDACLPAGGLQAHGLHELKPRTARDAGSALAFALALAARQGRSQRPLLVVFAGRAGAEHGLPYGPGLARLGLDPGRLLIVTSARSADALWAIEEGLRAGALDAVIASIEAVAMLPARRLVLAASEGATPCLVLTGPAKASISVAHTRWRIASAASAPHPLASAAPGAWRCALTLERCRQGPSDLTWSLEWSHASHSFDLAAALSPAAIAAARARRRTG